jgi:hypothetical protein
MKIKQFLQESEEVKEKVGEASKYVIYKNAKGKFGIVEKGKTCYFCPFTSIQKALEAKGLSKEDMKLDENLRRTIYETLKAENIKPDKIEDKDKITILSFVSAKEAANAYFKLLNSTKFEDIVKNTSLVGSTVKLQLKDNLDENIHNNIDDIVQRIYDKKLHEELLTNILQQLPKEVYTDTVRNFASLHKLGED